MNFGAWGATLEERHAAAMTLVGEVDPYELLCAVVFPKIAMSFEAQPTVATHCFHGHPLTDENSYTTSQGYTRCRICDRAYKRDPAAPRKRRDATACINGHEYNEVNTRMTTYQGRRCRVCERNRKRKRAA